MTQQLVNDVFIDCDPATAFDLLSDVRNETRWNKGVSAAEMQGDGAVREGSKFVTVYRGTENDISIAEFDRPERLVVAGTNPMMDIDTTYVFTAENGGTRLVVSTDARPKGLTSILSPLVRVFLRRELANKYAAVKKACESPSDSTSS